MTPEAKVKKVIRNVLDAAGCYYTMPVTAGFGKSGVADFVGCHRGRFFAIEAKANTVATALQLMNLRKVVQAGGHAFVVRINEKVEQGMDELNAFLAEGTWTP